MVAASAGVVAPAQVNVTTDPTPTLASATSFVRLLQARVGVVGGDDGGVELVVVELQLPAAPHCSP